jgi:hypothetical protein
VISIYHSISLPSLRCCYWELELGRYGQFWINCLAEEIQPITDISVCPFYILHLNGQLGNEILQRKGISNRTNSGRLIKNERINYRDGQIRVPVEK